MPVRKYTLDELRGFEARMGVALPQAYRRYLTERGAGEDLRSKVSLLEDWCQPESEDEMPSGFLSRPFPWTDRWNDLTLVDPAEGWKARYYSAEWWQGSMRIQNLGCEAYRLLVITGQERGNIWCDERVSSGGGIFPLAWGKSPRVTIDELLRSRAWRWLTSLVG